MLSFHMFARLHPRRYVSPPPRGLCGRRLPRPCRGGGAYPEPPRRASDCSILFHSPNSPLSTSNSQPFPFSTPPKSFICNIYAPPRKCCKQKTYAQTKPFRCNIYAKPGGGVELLEDVSAVPMQMQNGRKGRSIKKGRTEARPYRERSDG